MEVIFVINIKLNSKDVLKRDRNDQISCFFEQTDILSLNDCVHCAHINNNLHYPYLESE